MLLFNNLRSIHVLEEFSEEDEKKNVLKYLKEFAAEFVKVSY